jgi:ribosomal protein S12 methylthiotransferase accessory factor
VATRGLDVIAVDLTTPDIDDVGFKVVRAVIPGLQPLDIDHRHRHLGGRRLAEVPWRMGLANAPVGEDAFNPHPHPFP